MEQIEGIIYEYFVVCKINNEYKFLSIADENNKEYSKGTYFLGNNYKEIIVYQTFDDAKSDANLFDFVRYRYIEKGFDVSPQLRAASAHRKIKLDLDNYTEGG